MIPSVVEAPLEEKLLGTAYVETGHREQNAPSTTSR